MLSCGMATVCQSVCHSVFVYMCVCVCACVYACVCLCARACVCVCVCARVCVCVCARVCMCLRRRQCRHDGDERVRACTVQARRSSTSNYFYCGATATGAAKGKGLRVAGPRDVTSILTRTPGQALHSTCFTRFLLHCTESVS